MNEYISKHEVMFVQMPVDGMVTHDYAQGFADAIDAVLAIPPTHEQHVQRVESVGDTISRQAAVESIATALLQMDDPDAPRRTVEDYMPLAESMIRGVPAADVRENRRGTWIWDDEGYHCSECFFHAYGNTLECLDGTYKYCPNCGAEMRGSDDD